MSKSKSKTRRISKSSQPNNLSSELEAELASKAEVRPEFSSEILVGHRPGRTLTPQDQALFRSFQSNLLSLISHELRTPLMGVLNSLTLLEEADQGPIQSAEFLAMAKRNAQRLQQTLATLLDLAAIESRRFGARLKEIDLSRLIRARVEEAEGKSAAFRDRKAVIVAELPDLKEVQTPVFADAHKIARALDLCLSCAFTRMMSGSQVQLRISSNMEWVLAVELRFELEGGFERAFDDAWSLGATGAESGAGLPASAFGGVLQSEEDFLSRSEEGLGGEFLLIHEIMRLHSGRFEQERDASRVVLRLVFPKFTPREALNAVLASRAYEHTIEPTAVALVLVAVPKGGDIAALQSKLKSQLYRTTDSAFALTDLGLVAVVMNDYPKKDMEKFLSRMQGLFPEAAQYQSRDKSWISMVHFPEDIADPEALFDEAHRRLKSSD